MKKLLVLDTFNFLHRAYHALPKTFTDPEGEPINAVYGVTSMIISVLDQIRPTYIAAALDSEKPTFRVEEFTQYKAQREPMDEELANQIPKVFEILDAFGIKKIVAEGFEADDVIGTIATKFSNKVDVIIVSNDRDLWQLTNHEVMIMYPQRNKTFDWIGGGEAKARLGFDPGKITDFKGLRGDPSDNIPGVKGIGEKTATKLIQDFGTMENIYKNIEDINSGSLKEKLLENYEIALLSKRLAQLILDVPIEIKLQDLKYSDLNRSAVKEVLQKYNFKSLIKRLGFEISDATKEKVSDNQLSLL